MNVKECIFVLFLILNLGTTSVVTAADLNYMVKKFTGPRGYNGHVKLVATGGWQYHLQSGKRVEIGVQGPGKSYTRENWTSNTYNWDTSFWGGAYCEFLGTSTVSLGLKANETVIGIYLTTEYGINGLLNVPGLGTYKHTNGSGTDDIMMYVVAPNGESQSSVWSVHNHQYSNIIRTYTGNHVVTGRSDCRRGYVGIIVATEPFFVVPPEVNLNLN